MVLCQQAGQGRGNTHIHTHCEWCPTDDDPMPVNSPGVLLRVSQGCGKLEKEDQLTELVQMAAHRQALEAVMDSTGSHYPVPLVTAL